MIGSTADAIVEPGTTRARPDSTKPSKKQINAARMIGFSSIVPVYTIATPILMKISRKAKLGQVLGIHCTEHFRRLAGWDRRPVSTPPPPLDRWRQGSSA